MAIPWLTVLTSVPWSDVINNAPKVADGAKRLWQAMGRGRSGDAAVPVEASAAPAPADAVPARVAALEAETAALRRQLLASGELIKELAEQNASLVERIELNRRRLVGVAWLTLAALLAGVAALVVALGR
ncbi:hypothetical protein EZJ19_09510 [Parasulfuritortus cantonensis]|uniref:Uncharacterized protein n=1 Tax=Parasulfuritortus cantonensis TaxID=2528202 RepID=A0A4R1BCD0_9PROT|nr:hypothetical protein [Parasulfuritortus cantonensis]TCJ14673.1 hypothetical protein EZJ19_09510 [Parasulfuritortus cantonensis]